MRKGIIAALFAAALSVVACYNDDDLQKKVDELDQRVTTLEEQVKELNEKTVPGLQATVAAIQNGVMVSKVSKGADGTTILFSDGTTAFIKDGEKGEKGDDAVAPVIGVTEVDGVFYWTVDGEIVKDAEGNSITVYAALPQFRINEGKWEVSYDNGATWAVVATMGQADALPISIQDDENTVTFYIGEESYVIQKEHAFFISFNLSDRKNIGVPQGEEFMYEYTVNGVAEGDELEVDILNVTDGWEASVVALPKNGNPGYIAVKNLENKDGKVFVYAANGKGKTDIKSLVFEGGVLTADMDVKTVGAEGGNLVLTVVTNMDYELYIPKNQSWLTKAPETKATHTDVITLVAAANETQGYRSTEVDVILQNMDTKAFVILQTPDPSQTTDLASVSGLADETSVTLYKATVLAVSEESAVIGDGTTNLYCETEAKLPLGKLVNVVATKFSDEDYNTYVVVESFTELEEETEVTDAEIVYHGLAGNYAPAYSSITGVVENGASGYSIETVTGPVAIFDDPVESVGVDALVGKLAVAYGYIAKVDADENYTFVVKEIADASMTENSAWTLSYKNDPDSDPSYPETITNTVSGSDVPYMLTYYTKEEFDEMGEQNAVVMVSDDLQYSYWLYGLLYGYTVEQLNEIFLHSETSTESFKTFDYGKYVAVAVGMNEDGTITGDYKITEFEKVDPSVPAEYSDFLGDWVIGANTVVISEKVNGESYNIDGLASSVNSDNKVIEGLYDSENKCLVIMEQKIGNRNISSYGNCSVHLVAMYNDGYSVYPGWPINADEPGSAMIFKLQEDGSIIIAGGQVFDKYDKAYYGVVGYRFRWIIDEGADAGKGNWDGAQVSLPIAAEKAQTASSQYSAWLGNYTVNTVDASGASVEIPVTFVQGIPNKTVLLNGLGIDGIVFNWDDEADKLVMPFGVFASNSSYDFYSSGITNDNYVATGDANGNLVELVNESGTIKAKSIVYSLSAERPEVYASYWGVLGKNLSTGGWATFKDCQYIYNNATFAKSAGTSALKSISNPTANKTVKMDPNFKDVKIGSVDVKRSASKKNSDARASMATRKSAIR